VPLDLPHRQSKQIVDKQFPFRRQKKMKSATLGATAGRTAAAALALTGALAVMPAQAQNLIIGTGGNCATPTDYCSGGGGGGAVVDGNRQNAGNIRVSWRF
jgi:hypothetical protein